MLQKSCLMLLADSPGLTLQKMTTWKSPWLASLVIKLAYVKKFHSIRVILCFLARCDTMEMWFWNIEEDFCKVCHFLQWNCDDTCRFLPNIRHFTVHSHPVTHINPVSVSPSPSSSSTTPLPSSSLLPPPSARPICLTPVSCKLAPFIQSLYQGWVSQKNLLSLSSCLLYCINSF